MVSSMGDRTEYLDNRELAEAGLSKEEHSQLTKMSLSKIVGNLRNKLKEEEARIQLLSLKID